MYVHIAVCTYTVCRRVCMYIGTYVCMDSSPYVVANHPDSDGILRIFGHSYLSAHQSNILMFVSTFMKFLDSLAKQLKIIRYCSVQVEFR